MAVASKLKGELDRQHIAVIGDGAMTAGLAFEALNHGGVENSNMIVILNDNCMSIDPNVGALKEKIFWRGRSEASFACGIRNGQRLD